MALIFSAQTTPTGNTVPGTGRLPASLRSWRDADPGFLGNHRWWAGLDQLGSWSGQCFAAGCGYTGWIQEDYTIPTAGTYELAFGVSNANDGLYDTGLAYSGVEVNGKPVGTPEPSTLLMLGSALFGLASLSRKFLS